MKKKTGLVSRNIEEAVVAPTEYHVPVMLKESVDGLNIRDGGIYVDVTYGGGGHSREIIRRLGKNGRLLGFDQDLDVSNNAVDDPRFTFVRSNFCYLRNFLRYHGIDKVNGILADLGVSSHHFDEPERGFSFRFEGRLDMRMNQQSDLTAARILNDYTEEKLANIFYYYGELSQARKIANAVVRSREFKFFESVSDLLDVLKPFFFREREKQDMAKVFQALRIEVNQELEVLKMFLEQCSSVLAVGGRLVILTYHSLEDRIVKNFMKTGNVNGDLEKDFFGNIISDYKLLNNRVITPSREEIERNPRARSAKLRIAEKKDSQ